MRDKHSSKKILLTIVALLVLLTCATGAVIARTQPTLPHVAVTRSGNQFMQLSYQGQAGKSALALLKIQAQVVTKDSPYGVYVVSINGIGDSNKYWMFYVNGQQVPVGAAQYITKTGDVVSWKLE